ncbi:hypothetical protein G7045_02545 [Acidovorax sp. HDW3]|uniref:hypothetical protein n=1 Tax=Acidovorax sp. HDW3 TaxID=2714923 RepID=UPI0014098555|nr:hypothetical protein [Acidovorax sp. HDW3]QIL43237.1 hypothetical protein G7045_02545 [Acidovorax sp. HDW3]
MRIESSALQWQSQHSASRTEAHSTRLQAWVGQRPPARAPTQPETTARSDQPQISPQARRLLQQARQATPEATQATTSHDSTRSDQLPPLLRMASDLIEKMTGVRAHIVDAQALTPSATTAPAASPAASNPPSAGWGLAYDEHHVVQESETTQYAAAGVVRTADGREIRFSVALLMQRSYREESSISLRLGDAQAPMTDPLVINFDGTAAQLQDLRFEFDLNSDGQAENIPLLAGNRGFLALDRNGNGQIDNGSELFGPGSGNGFSELAAYDDDGNGWIDESDGVFAQLRVWTPTADGPGTLRSLQALGVGALSLTAGQSEFALRDAHNRSLGAVRASSVYLNENGSAGTLQHVDLTA